MSDTNNTQTQSDIEDDKSVIEDLGDEESAHKGGRLKEILHIFHKHEIIRGVTPEKVRLIIEDLGPTFVKLGQIMSMHSEILPKEYCKELEKLRSDVKPMPFSQVKRVLENTYHRSLDEIFDSIEEEPIGAASIAQVHVAYLKGGEKVVLKVQREGVYEMMSKDMVLLHRGLRFFKNRSGFGTVDFDEIIDEMWSVAQEEMNFMMEASNIDDFARFNEDILYIDCPKLYNEYTTPQVLVMEYIDGIGIDDSKRLEEEEYDLKEICSKLIENYLKQILDDGFFHADPHPGNLRIRDGKIIWIDMGMMGKLSARSRALLDDVVMGIAQGDINLIKDGLIAIGETTERVDHHQLYVDLDEIVTRYAMSDLGDVNLSQIIDAFFEAMARNKIKIPGTYTMLVRGLATIEGLVAQLSPQTDILSIAKMRMNANMWERLDIKKELKRSGRIMYRSLRKALDIPGVTSDLLHMFMKGQGRVNLDLHSTDDLDALLTRLIKDLVLGFIVAALLISASIICTTDMRPKILGIPALGAFAFFLAFALAIYLIWQQFTHKRRHRK